MIHIISGYYKRKPIQIRGRTRPPLQRIREWVFNVIANYIDLHQSTVLDLFAGSGSFGLECISRGAKIVYFIEEDIDTAALLSQTLKDWDATTGKILRMNAEYLPECQDKPDVIFIDPPFGHKMPKKIIDKLFKKGWIEDHTCIMLRTETLFEDERLEALNMDCMGISYIYILRCKELT